MADQPQQPTPEPPAARAFEDLLFLALERLDAEGAAGIERFLAEHPAHAPKLRAHLERLHRMGFAATQAANQPRQQPERLGDFRILAPLGQGGMGVVYRAVQESLGREVALKLIRPDQLYFPGARERFGREVELVARMQHPGIVPVYAVGSEAGVPYFAMELVHGATLADVITHLAGREPKTLDGGDLDHAVAACLGEAPAAEPAALFRGEWVQVVLRIVREVAEALEHAHRRGVLHRDVKPSNVMLTRDGRVLLLDFGLAGTDSAERLTRTGSALGSLAYMPPELLAGVDVKRDARCDVYSLGATCWELLALRLPYQSSDPVQLRQLAAAATRPKLATWNPTVSWDVETVIAVALDPDPARRYATASLFSRDLDNLLEHRPIEAREPGVTLRLRRWTQRHPARATAAAALVLALVVGPTLWAWQEARARVRSEAQRDELASTNQALDRAKAVAEVESKRAQTSLAKLEEAVDTMLTKVGDQSLRDIPRMETVRKELLEEALRYYEEFLADEPDDPALMRKVCRARLRAADVHGMLGDYAAAESQIERAVQDLTPLAEHDASLMFELVRARARLATIYRLRGNLAAAATTSAAAIDGWQKLAAGSSDRLLAKGLGDAQLEASHLAVARGDLDGALALLEQGLADLDSWRRRNGGRSDLDHLQARMLDRAGVCVYQQAMQLRDPTKVRGQAQHAIDLHRRAAELWPGVLARLPNDTSVRADAADNATDLAIALSALGKVPEAKEAMAKAVALFEGLAADFPGVPRRHEQLANARLNFAGMLAATGATEQCVQEVTLARQAFERLCADAPANDELASGLCYALQTSAVMTLELQGRPAEALQYADAAGVAIDRALAVRPANDSYHTLRRKVFETTAELCLRLGDHKRAAAAARGLLDARWGPTQPVLAAAFLARAAPLAAADATVAAAERTVTAEADHQEARALLAAAIAGGLQLDRLRADPSLSDQWGKPAFEDLCKEVAASGR